MYSHRCSTANITIWIYKFRITQLYTWSGSNRNAHAKFELKASRAEREWNQICVPLLNSFYRWQSFPRIRSLVSKKHKDIIKSAVHNSNCYVYLLKGRKDCGEIKHQRNKQCMRKACQVTYSALRYGPQPRQTTARTRNLQLDQSCNSCYCIVTVRYTHDLLRLLRLQRQHLLPWLWDQTNELTWPSSIVVWEWEP